jgi:hypothetical protein
VLMWVQEEQQIHVFATSLPNQWSLREVQYGHCCHHGWMKRPQYIRKGQTQLCKKSILLHVQKMGTSLPCAHYQNKLSREKEKGQRGDLSGKITRFALGRRHWRRAHSAIEGKIRSFADANKRVGMLMDWMSMSESPVLSFSIENRHAPHSAGTKSMGDSKVSRPLIDTRLRFTINGNIKSCKKVHQ